ncbi:hypothetical protein GNI_067270 [Gregarina niphandrodes]|uniref:Uncharacterized protein n=1 Tax=Gregarina niphandrodes TaxID=110365 RepID=A0A023B7N9_GRENI|nr:hypothetical protein GNI_067270 [Gregarina niphandrodes]EZG67631.1 hypothetical protein GNI_067270 [Gregarina niphandrodes]|eukprot:XP_011130184.1 hypothetical protein GNI_067270 [Gregarina niphandrodes]
MNLRQEDVTRIDESTVDQSAANPSAIEPSTLEPPMAEPAVVETTDDSFSGTPDGSSSVAVDDSKVSEAVEQMTNAEEESSVSNPMFHYKGELTVDPKSGEVLDIHKADSTSSSGGGLETAAASSAAAAIAAVNSDAADPDGELRAAGLEDPELEDSQLAEAAAIGLDTDGQTIQRSPTVGTLSTDGESKKDTVAFGHQDLEHVPRADVTGASRQPVRPHKVKSDHSTVGQTIQTHSAVSRGLVPVTRLSGSEAHETPHSAKSITQQLNSGFTSGQATSTDSETDANVMAQDATGSLRDGEDSAGSILGNKSLLGSSLLEQGDSVSVSGSTVADGSPVAADSSVTAGTTFGTSTTVAGDHGSSDHGSSDMPVDGSASRQEIVPAGTAATAEKILPAGEGVSQGAVTAVAPSANEHTASGGSAKHPVQASGSLPYPAVRPAAAYTAGTAGSVGFDTSQTRTETGRGGASYAVIAPAATAGVDKNRTPEAGFTSGTAGSVGWVDQSSEAYGAGTSGVTGQLVANRDATYPVTVPRAAAASNRDRTAGAGYTSGTVESVGWANEDQGGGGRGAAGSTTPGSYPVTVPRAAASGAAASGAAAASDQGRAPAAGYSSGAVESVGWADEEPPAESETAPAPAPAPRSAMVARAGVSGATMDAVDWADEEEREPSRAPFHPIAGTLQVFTETDDAGDTKSLVFDPEELAEPESETVAEAEPEAPKVEKRAAQALSLMPEPEDEPDAACPMPARDEAVPAEPEGVTEPEVLKAAATPALSPAPAPVVAATPRSAAAPPAGDVEGGHAEGGRAEGGHSTANGQGGKAKVGDISINVNGGGSGDCGGDCGCACYPECCEDDDDDVSDDDVSDDNVSDVDSEDFGESHQRRRNQELVDEYDEDDEDDYEED